jgi:hypothetical protein
MFFGSPAFAAYLVELLLQQVFVTGLFWLATVSPIATLRPLALHLNSPLSNRSACSAYALRHAASYPTHQRGKLIDRLRSRWWLRQLRCRHLE